MVITNLLTNMVVLALNGEIQTNTPAFLEFAQRTMLTNAQAMAASWHLESAVIASNKITRFKAVPHFLGFTGSIVFENRYVFRYQSGWFTGFEDNSYASSFLISYEEARANKVVEKWLAATNLLTLRKARAIAEASLQSIGINPDGQPLTEWQETQYRKTGSIVLPYYIFTWRSNRWDYLDVEISGINGRVAYLGNRYYSAMRIKRPANYLSLLGLPTDTIFVKHKYPSSDEESYGLSVGNNECSFYGTGNQ